MKNFFKPTKHKFVSTLLFFVAFGMPAFMFFILLLNTVMPATTPAELFFNPTPIGTVSALILCSLLFYFFACLITFFSSKFRLKPKLSETS